MDFYTTFTYYFTVFIFYKKMSNRNYGAAISTKTKEISVFYPSSLWYPSYEETIVEYPINKPNFVPNIVIWGDDFELLVEMELDGKVIKNEGSYKVKNFPDFLEILNIHPWIANTIEFNDLIGICISTNNDSEIEFFLSK